MMKKILYLLILTVCLAAAPSLAARQISGQWSVLSTTGDAVEIIETGSRTYYLLGPSLFSLDDDGEFYAYNSANKLNDSGISGIWYNAGGRYLAIAYSNGNIDLLYNDGSVVNMAEIKDAVVSGSHRINDMAFAKGNIYVATDFGLVVYDDSKHIVKESGIYNQVVDNVMTTANHLIIVSDHITYIAPYDIRHNQLDKFNRLGIAWASDFVPVGDDRYLFIHTDGPVYLSQINQSTSVTNRILDTGGAKGTSLGRSNGGAYFTYDNKICFISETDGTTQTATLPDGYGLPAFAADGLKSVWATGDDGLANFDLSSDKPKLLSKGFMPDGVTTDLPASMQWSADGERLYIGNVGVSLVFSGVESGAPSYNVPAHTSYIENGYIYNAQPRRVSIDHEVFTQRQEQNGVTGIIGGPGRLSVDPDDNSIIYLPTRLAGLFVLKDGKVVNVFNQKNSPITEAYFGNGANRQPVAEVMYAGTDQDGNLWMMELLPDGLSSGRTMKVLPAAKRKGRIDKVTTGDWTTFEIPGTFKNTYMDFQVLFCKKSNMNFIFHGDTNMGFVAMSNNGTPSNFRDDKLVQQSILKDQSGKTLNYGYLTCAVEDAEGKVWMGTKLGVFVIDRPADALNSTFNVRLPIVPRNDGTNLGDYLLSTEKINGIAVDPTNRKWIATENSGLYLVSADGTEILQNFTTANSPLPDNCVYSVSCDMSSNKVYVGAAGATLVYDSDASPAAESYSDIYAYPNPVRPEYTGWITVTGLMDNSLVKIADATGNVFFQGKSEGGMITWDGCDASGQRVRSGIYFVFASQNGQGSSGAVTKIMVIN